MLGNEARQDREISGKCIYLVVIHYNVQESTDKSTDSVPGPVPAQAPAPGILSWRCCLQPANLSSYWLEQLILVALSFCSFEQLASRWTKLRFVLVLPQSLEFGLSSFYDRPGFNSMTEFSTFLQIHT
jgi:hypothetical protein